jgi:hypothetical protein
MKPVVYDPKFKMATVNLALGQKIIIGYNPVTKLFYRTLKRERAYSERPLCRILNKLSL